jgi:hypothetical protein
MKRWLVANLVVLVYVGVVTTILAWMLLNQR